nr:uncharacterized protein LOC122272758 isoform X2 [Parasteatoda tepidariorum]
MGGITSMKTALKIPAKVDKIIIEDFGVLVNKDFLNFAKLVFSLHEQAILNMPKVSTEQEAAKFLSDFMYERVPDDVKPHIRKAEGKNSNFLNQNSDGSISHSSNLKVLRKSLENEDTLISKYEGMMKQKLLRNIFQKPSLLELTVLLTIFMRMLRFSSLMLC